MNSTYQLTLSRDAIKFVSKQEKAIKERIKRALVGLTIRPPVGDIFWQSIIAGMYINLFRKKGEFNENSP